MCTSAGDALSGGYVFNSTSDRIIIEFKTITCSFSFRWTQMFTEVQNQQLSKPALQMLWFLTTYNTHDNQLAGRSQNYVPYYIDIYLNTS